MRVDNKVKVGLEILREERMDENGKNPMIRIIGKIGRCWERLKGVRNYFLFRMERVRLRGDRLSSKFMQAF